MLEHILLIKGYEESRRRYPRICNRGIRLGGGGEVGDGERGCGGREGDEGDEDDSGGYGGGGVGVGSGDDGDGGERW